MVITSLLSTFPIAYQLFFLLLQLQKLFMSRFHKQQPPERVKLTRWQDCMDLVQYHPEDVTILLIAAGSFKEIDFWINNFSLPHHLTKVFPLILFCN